MRSLAIFAIASTLVLSACVSKPDTPPTVANAALSKSVVDPGESFDLSFTLESIEHASIRRVFLRGLPPNAVFAGTKTELSLPLGPVMPYKESIALQKPAADGLYDLELVIEFPDVRFTAPLGVLQVRDIPSRITFAQFVPGSHAGKGCGTITRPLELQYTVVDDNGAADFVDPRIVPLQAAHESLVFFPHWEPIAWRDGVKGIVLNRPSQVNEEEELVVNDLRVFCQLESKSLYEYKILGQNVTNPSGASTTIESGVFKYYVK